MVEEWELKIHQSSHALYFEDFLKFVTYEQSIPEIINDQVLGYVQTYVENKWEPAEVVEAASRIIEIKPEIELNFKIGDTYIKGFLADYGDKIHIASFGDRYALVIEGDSFTFDKGFSPVELLQPEPFEKLAERLLDKKWSGDEEGT